MKKSGWFKPPPPLLIRSFTFPFLFQLFVCLCVCVSLVRCLTTNQQYVSLCMYVCSMSCMYVVCMYDVCKLMYM
jgi:hypothetical protein